MLQVRRVVGGDGGDVGRIVVDAEIEVGTRRAPGIDGGKEIRPDGVVVEVRREQQHGASAVVVLPRTELIGNLGDGIGIAWLRGVRTREHPSETPAWQIRQL